MRHIVPIKKLPEYTSMYNSIHTKINENQYVSKNAQFLFSIKVDTKTGAFFTVTIEPFAK